MNTTNLLAELQERGVTLTLAGDRLRWRGPRGAVTPALKAALLANKAEVRRVLEGRDPPTWEARAEALLAELEAATGCPDAQAEELLGKWAVLEEELGAIG